MFQLVGSLLALAAIGHVAADLPVAGTVFALLTLAWVLIAKPAPSRKKYNYDHQYGAPRGAVLGA